MRAELLLQAVFRIEHTVSFGVWVARKVPDGGGKRRFSGIPALWQGYVCPWSGVE
jgi:hypothetical protein